MGDSQPFVFLNADAQPEENLRIVPYDENQPQPEENASMVPYDEDQPQPEENASMVPYDENQHAIAELDQEEVAELDEGEDFLIFFKGTVQSLLLLLSTYRRIPVQSQALSDLPPSLPIQSLWERKGNRSIKGTVQSQPL